MTPKFKIGFELELNIPPTYGTCSEVYDGRIRFVPPSVPFWKGITEIPGLSKVVEGYDCHNDLGMKPAEIRTPPQPIDEGIASFFELIKYLAGFPDNHVYSTEKCGLHINVSEETMMKEQLTSLRFLNHIIQHYPEWAVMERFNRQENRTCRPWFSRGTAVVDRVKAQHPYWATIGMELNYYRHENSGLSVSNKELANPSTNRIEFRGHGNTGYHKKVSDLRFAIDSIVESCTTAFHNVLTDSRPREELIQHNW